MKYFTNLVSKIKEHPKLQFALYVAVFYLLLMAMYMYVIHANLSTAPTFVYSQF